MSTVNDDLKCRIEWAEGVNPRWDFWVFDQEEDLQVNDVLVSEELNLGLTVLRVSPWYSVKGKFHHYEIVTEEHMLSVAQLLT